MWFLEDFSLGHLIEETNSPIFLFLLPFFPLSIFPAKEMK